MKDWVKASTQQRDKIKILFLGQCIAAGIEVGAQYSYPVLTTSLLQARFPQLKFEVDFKPLLHPTGLQSLMSASLGLKPDIIFLSLPAVFAALPYRVNSLYLVAPEVMNLARNFVRKIELTIGKNSKLLQSFKQKTVLMPTVAMPVVSLDEYERLTEEALLFCQQNSRCRLVLMGPGGFNEDTRDSNALTPELFRSLNDRILNLGKRCGVTVINANDLMQENDGSVFLRGNQRWSASGHQVMARELASVFTAEILSLQFSTVG
ncbi:MAG: hypothetical protein HY231_12370 [Acidobacteria bacterium]|nr:hypothetical protein [Acidobacteriota bacterium]